MEKDGPHIEIKLYPVLRGRSALVGQVGAVGDTILQVLQEQGMKVTLVSEDLTGITNQAADYDVIIIHVPYSQQESTKVQQAKDLEKIWRKNKHLIFLVGPMHSENSGEELGKPYLKRGCMEIERSYGRWSGSMKNTLPLAVATLLGNPNSQ